MNNNEGDYYPLSRTMLTPLQYRYSVNNSGLDYQINQASMGNLSATSLDEHLATRYKPLNLMTNSYTSIAQSKRLLALEVIIWSV